MAKEAVPEQAKPSGRSSASAPALPPVAPASLHQRILADIQQRILSGKWPPGYRIPSEQEFTESYDCSRMTVNKVLTQLAQAGLIERRRKAGSFVKSTQSRSAVLEIQDVGAEVAALGLPYRYNIAERKKQRSTRVDAQALGLEAPGPVLRLTTLHYAGPRVFCLEQRLINLASVPGAAGEEFAQVSPGPWLVGHVPWTSAEHRIRAAAADVETAPMLRVKRGTPCLIVERRTWTGGKPVTFVRLTYPGDGHELVAHFSPVTAGSDSSEAG